MTLTSVRTAQAHHGANAVRKQYIQVAWTYLDRRERVRVGSVHEVCGQPGRVVVVEQDVAVGRTIGRTQVARYALVGALAGQEVLHLLLVSARQKAALGQPAHVFMYTGNCDACPYRNGQLHFTEGGRGYSKTRKSAKRS